MLKFITGNPLLFLLIWLLIYALLLFTLSAIGEWRRYHSRNRPRLKETDRGFSIQLPAQISGRRVWPRDGPEWLPGARVVNRSQGGLRLTYPRPFNTGQQLRVLSSLAPNNVLWADVEVRNCRQGRDGFELGCQFVYAHPLNVVLLFG